MLALAPERVVTTRPRPRYTVSDGVLEELASSLQHETALVELLRTTLLEQRAAVAADDGETVDATVHAIGRALLTLNEARRRRTALVEQIAGEALPLARLEEVLEAPLPPRLAEAREAVRRTARLAAQDLAINQQVLRGALDAGEAYIQHLFSASGQPSTSYTGAPRPDRGGDTGRLLNRVV